MFSIFQTMKNAIESGSLNEVKRLIRANDANKNTRYTLPNGYTPLIHAAEKGELDIVKFLVQVGARVEDAIYINNVEGRRVPKYVIDFVLDKIDRDSYREIAQTLFIEIAISRVNDIDRLVAAVDQGLSYNLDLNVFSIKSGNTMLIHAVRDGHFRSVEELINRYHVNLQTSVIEKTAWDIAIGSGKWSVARILFEANKKYLYEHKYYADYLKKLQEFTVEIIKHNSQELSIIQVIDSTDTLTSRSSILPLKSTPSKILVRLSKDSVFGDLIVYKLIYIENERKWSVDYSSIQDIDLYVLNSYYKRAISRDMHEKLFCAIAYDAEDKKEISLLQLNSIWLDHKVEYPILVGRDYTATENAILVQNMLERQVAELGDSHITFAVTLEEHEAKIDSISTELDNVRIEVNDIRTALDKLEIDLNGLMVIIGTAAAPYKDPSYERTLYLTLRWYLNSAYAASLVVSSPEGIVPNSKTGTVGGVGDVLKTISSHVPMGGGVVVEFFGTILKSIDAKHQASMVMHCAKLAPGSMGMEALSHHIAIRILDIISTLDITKMESTTSSMAEKCINMIVEAISWMSDNSAQIETAIHNPIRAVEEGAAALAAYELRRQAVEYFTQEITKLSKDKQLAQKHACIIATLLISRIYTGERLEEYEIISNANTLVEYITSEYVVVLTSSTQPVISPVVVQTTTSNLVSASQEKRSGCVSCCIVSYVIDMVYDNINPFLRNVELLHEAQKIGGMEAINDLIELGEDPQIACSIITEVKQYGAQHVLNILLRNNNRVDTASIKIEKAITEEIVLLDDEVPELYLGLDNNRFLSNNKGIEFIEVVKKLLGEEAALLLLELCQDESIVEQILHAVEEQGIEKVLSTLFNKEITTSIQEINDADNNVVPMITIIENVLGEQESQELTGLSQYIMNALSNNRMSDSARQVIKIMSKLVQNLEDLLEINSMHGEEVSSYDNYVTVIWAQLAGLFEFIESGQRFINFVPRPPYFDPDSDSGGYDDSDGGSGKTSNGQNFDNDTNAYLPMFLIGYNLTITSDS